MHLPSYDVEIDAAALNDKAKIKAANEANIKNALKNPEYIEDILLILQEAMERNAI